ncbi:hypothetical protein ACVDG5_015010 [Mesorhizobium sp. ORM6]
MFFAVQHGQNKDSSEIGMATAGHWPTLKLSHGVHKNVFSHGLTNKRLRCDLRRAKSLLSGASMKKTYEKPVLVKREKLSSVVAVVGSGPF